MIVNVRMKDGLTTFQFASRKDFVRTLGQDPSADDALVRQTAWVKRNPGAEEPWHRMRIAFINRHSVAFVIAAEDTPDYGLPAKETADERRRKFEAQEE